MAPMRQATPFLSVDLVRLEANLARVQQYADQAVVDLRPHVKTHKCPEIARRQLALGAVGVTVATVGEAEVFVGSGCDDVFVAYPLWVDDALAIRLRELAARARIRIGVDSADSARVAAAGLRGSGVTVLVEVDSGHHRTGVPPSGAGAVAMAAKAAGLQVDGVFTFPGHSYAPETRRAAAVDEAAALGAAVEALAAAGLPAAVVSGGSTPSLEHTDTAVLTELRPGVYAFGDAQQWELATIDPATVALTCEATVVSHAGGRAVLDSGSKILGADRAPYASGFGRLLDHPDARLVLLSEHHAVVDLGGEPLPRLGSRVRVVPNHVCSAVNLVDELHVTSPTGDESWPVSARGRND